MGLSWDELKGLEIDPGWMLPIPPLCPFCNYNLTGIKELRCPECGVTFEWHEVHRHGRRLTALARRAAHANKDAKIGFCVGLLSAVLAVIIRLPIMQGGPCGARLVLFLSGLAAVYLAAQPINYYRLPAEVRNTLGIKPPNLLLSIATILIALAALASYLIWG